jgi:predicted esterase
MVVEKLGSFPSEGVAGEVLQAVRELLGEYKTNLSNRNELLAQFDALVEKIGDTALREQIGPIGQELHAELNFNTMDRMAAFRRMLEDNAMQPAEKVALAVSGWLIGSDDASTKLPLALSAYKVRNLIAEYLGAPDATTRNQLFERFHSEEAATLPAALPLVSKIVSHMKPPVPSPVTEGGKPGWFELQSPGRGNSPPVQYVVQLPPEYDPHRRYPTIVTLHGAGTTVSQQVDWWAGARTEQGWRSGQATRHGYIVVAPAWAAEHQKKYGYSGVEHAAVLDCLRDACRRFSIDTDRVFLSGHSMGGDAAWDLGLAHPDLWAGVIPIVATSDRYCALYWENAQRVPFYFVCGELDGDKLVENARDLDRYLKRGYNCTVVEYEGRGHEHFSDEIQRLFDWMGRLRRNFFPREFTAVTMRRWDNFFWWVELDELPEKAMIDPVDWPPPRGVNPMETKASVTAINGVRVLTGAARVRVWLSPEIVDFDRRVSVIVNGRRLLTEQLLEPDLGTFLDDVRTRADRQHPFWVKMETTTGRVPVSQ